MKTLITVLIISAVELAAAANWRGLDHASFYKRQVDMDRSLHVRHSDDIVPLLRPRGMFRAQTAREEGRGVKGNRKSPGPPNSPHKNGSPPASPESGRSRFTAPSRQVQASPGHQSLQGFDVPKSPALSVEYPSPVRSIKAEKAPSYRSSSSPSSIGGSPSPSTSRGAREGKSERSSLSGSPERRVPPTPPEWRSPASDRVKWTAPGETESPPPGYGSPRSQYSSPERHRTPPIQDSGTPASFVPPFAADASDSFGLSGASTVQPRPAPARRRLQMRGI